jgi:hypothetical protein
MVQMISARPLSIISLRNFIMVTIVNLSTIHTLHPISTTIKAFVELCNKYSDGYFSSYPGVFGWSNYAWVMTQYQKYDSTLIQPYKLGKISTDEFRQNLLSIFPFMSKLPAEEQRLLVEEAWNASIDIDETTANRFPELVRQSKSEPIYLISNTNELNVREIIRLLKQQNPDIEFFDNIDLSVQESKEPIEIAPNIYLCLSYRYQLFKTMTDTRKLNPHSTMSLLNYLVTEQLSTIPRSDIRVVSQYPGDLQEAAKLNIPKTNLLKADDYFGVKSLSFLMRVLTHPATTPTAAMLILLGASGILTGALLASTMITTVGAISAGVGGLLTLGVFCAGRSNSSMLVPETPVTQSLTASL